MLSIVIEGFDGCGKSQLARELSKLYTLGIHTIGSRPSSDKEMEYMSNLQISIAENSRVIFDRLTSISTMCYKNPCTNSLVMASHLANIVPYCIFIWCHTEDPEHVIKDYDATKHLEVISSTQQEIIDRYELLMDQVPHIKYDFKKNRLQDLMETINDEFRKA